MKASTNPFGRGTKKSMESIAVFQYYISSLFPRLFVQERSQQPSSFRGQCSDHNMRYSYAHGQCDSKQQIKSEDSLHAIWQLYASKQNKELYCKNLIHKSTQVKGSLFRAQEIVQEDVQICMKAKDGQRGQMRKKSGFLSPHKVEIKGDKSKQRKRSLQVVGRQDFTSNKAHDRDYGEYSIYAIHKPTNSTSGWEHFVERYYFANSEGHCDVIYDAAFSVKESGFFSLQHYHSVVEEFFLSSVFNNLDSAPKNLTLLMGKLENMALARCQERLLAEEKVSFDLSHRRQLALHKDERQIFNILKPKVYQYFAELNPERQPNRCFLDNLTCRIMVSNKCEQEVTWDSLRYYLRFERSMRLKYRWQDFQVYHDMHIFTYIGKDKMGRPVLLNRLRNVLCSQIQDFDHFFDYHFYLFQIFLQDQMKGWVDQFSVIADTSNQVADNTNLSFSKRIITQAMKLCMGRHYKIVAFDVGFLGMTLYSIVKNILPSSFIDTIKIVGRDRKELIKELNMFINISTIPEFIGGLNPTIESQQLQITATDATNDF